MTRSRRQLKGDNHEFATTTWHGCDVHIRCCRHGDGLGRTGHSTLPRRTNDFLGQLTATYNDPTGPGDNNPYDFDIVTKVVQVTDTITAVLLYHVLPGANVTGADVLSGPFTQRVTMANGEKLRITVLSCSARFPVVILGDKDGRLFNDSVVRSKIDAVKTDNTVVHGISNVLLPTL